MKKKKINSLLLIIIISGTLLFLLIIYFLSADYAFDESLKHTFGPEALLIISLIFFVASIKENKNETQKSILENNLSDAAILLKIQKLEPKKAEEIIFLLKEKRPKVFKKAKERHCRKFHKQYHKILSFRSDNINRYECTKCGVKFYTNEKLIYFVVLKKED